MLQQILTLGTILLAMQTVSAEDTPTSSNPAMPHPISACGAKDAPHASCDQRPGKAACECMSKGSTHNKQQLLLQQKCGELDRLQREITQLREATGTVQQILVKVQVLEVHLTKLRKMSTDVDCSANGCFIESQIRQILDSTDGRVYGHVAEPAAKEKSNECLQLVEWLKRKNVAKVLAEPTLVTVSGRPASVEVGGEFPVPTNDDSKAAVDFRKFGTKLDLLAFALGDNQVRLEVGMRVSTIDNNHAIEVNGDSIPGLNVRQCDTASQLTFGQTGVVMGFVAQRTETVAKTDQGQERMENALNDVGLMLVVTPVLVHPPEASAASANRDIEHAVRK